MQQEEQEKQEKQEEISNDKTKQEEIQQEAAQPEAIKIELIFETDFKRPKKLCEKSQIVNEEKDAFVIRYDQDDCYVATGFANGKIKLLNLDKNLIVHSLQGSTKEEETPTTCLRWRPSQNKQKYILVSGNSDGSIVHWHAPSGKALHKIVEEDNSVLAIDFNFDGNVFATGGKDFCVRVYDDNIKSVFHTYAAADWFCKYNNISRSQRGHSNRIFSVKFLSDQPNVMITGGWDANILVWDIRERSCIGRQFYGPSLSGDALDFCASKQMILSGSYRSENQIQLWDFRTRKLFKNVKWTGDDREENKQIYVYTAQFSKLSDDLILAGCSGQHEVKMFDIKRDCQPCAAIKGLQKGIYSVDFANTQQKFAFSGGDGNAYIIQFE